MPLASCSGRGVAAAAVAPASASGCRGAGAAAVAPASASGCRGAGAAAVARRSRQQRPATTSSLPPILQKQAARSSPVACAAESTWLSGTLSCGATLIKKGARRPARVQNPRADTKQRGKNSPRLANLSSPPLAQSSHAASSRKRDLSCSFRSSRCRRFFESYIITSKANLHVLSRVSELTFFSSSTSTP